MSEDRDSWVNGLFESEVSVASETETVERGGILAWRLLRCVAGRYFSLSTLYEWSTFLWHEAQNCCCGSYWCGSYWRSLDREKPDLTSNIPHRHGIGCGFYAYSHLQSIPAYYCDGYGDQAIVPVIIAGRVIPHKNGYRSSRMRLLMTPDASPGYWRANYSAVVQEAERHGAAIPRLESWPLQQRNHRSWFVQPGAIMQPGAIRPGKRSAHS